MAVAGFFKEFKNFVERGSAIDMAVGIIVGSVMTGVVNSLVKDIIMPPIGLLIGGIDFSQFFIVLSGGEQGVHYNTIEAAQAAGAATMNIGLFLNAIISFFITMFAVFLLVRIMNKVRSKEAVTTRSCPYCKSSISVSATKCAHCCSDVEPVEAIPAQESELTKSLQKIISKAASGKISKNKKKTAN